MRAHGLLVGAVAAVLLSLGAGCTAEGDRADTGSGDAGSIPQRGEPEVSGGVGVLSAVPGVGPAIIKTAELEVQLERDGLDPAVDTVTEAVRRYQGFVVSSEVFGEEDRRGRMVLRVPADRFEEVLSMLRGLGTVERERVEGEDVSEEFVDLEARLRNLESQEGVLLRLMNEAASVSDTIRVQGELSTVQQQVEQIRGRLRFLRDRTSFGTIALDVSEPGAAQAPGVFGRAWQQAVAGFVAVVGGLIAGAGVALPVAILAMAVALGWRRSRTRASRRPAAV